MYAYIDESGDHNLNMVTVDNNYNVFVLGLVLIEKNNYPEIDSGLKQIKKEVFGSEDFIIHTNELTHPLRPDSDKRNRILRDPKLRFDFYNKINKFIEDAKLKASFVVVKKSFFQEKYAYPADPYELSFENLLNRVLYFSKSNDINIFSECRSKALDKALVAEFSKYSIRGTRFHSAETILKRIKSFDPKDKKENDSGLQIVDLLTNPVGRHFLGIKPKPIGNEVPYALVRKKLASNESLSITVIP